MRKIDSLLLALCGCAASAPPPSANTPAPPPSPITPAEAGAVAIPVSLCILDGNELRKVEGGIHPATGDTLVSGRRFSEAYPSSAPPYAGGMPWYHDRKGDFISLAGTVYIRFGVPRVFTAVNIHPSTFLRVGDLHGVPIFADHAGARPPDVIYLAVRAGCAFQPYQQRPVHAGPPPPGSVFIDGGPLPQPPLIATPVAPAPAP